MGNVEKTTSADGTTIAFERYGEGPAAVVVGGAFCDRGAFRQLAQALGQQGLTGVTYDRRGRGESGDTGPYAVEREIEDLTAVVEAVGAEPGFAHGVSSGGALVLRAAGAGAPLAAVSTLEVPYRIEGAPPVPENYIETLDAFNAAGDNEGTLRFFHTRAVGLPEEMLEGMKGTPMWEPMLALAPTVVYDGWCMGGNDQSFPAELLASITVPVLSVNSTGTQLPFLREAAVKVAEATPRGRHAALEGGFHEVPAETLAPVLAEFYRAAGQTTERAVDQADVRADAWTDKRAADQSTDPDEE